MHIEYAPTSDPDVAARRSGRRRAALLLALSGLLVLAGTIGVSTSIT